LKLHFTLFFFVVARHFFFSTPQTFKMSKKGLPPVYQKKKSPKRGGGNSCRRNGRYACNYGNIQSGKCPGYIVGGRPAGAFKNDYVMNWKPKPGTPMGQTYTHQGRIGTPNADSLEDWNKTRCLPRNENGKIKVKNRQLREASEEGREGNEFCEEYRPSSQREQKGCVNRNRPYIRRKYPGPHNSIPNPRWVAPAGPAGAAVAAVAAALPGVAALLAAQPDVGAQVAQQVADVARDPEILDELNLDNFGPLENFLGDDGVDAWNNLFNDNPDPLGLFNPVDELPDFNLFSDL
jgi:hypothetical protein